MNAIISLCHFCELHGPSILFCTQAFHSHDPQQVLEAGGGDSSLEASAGFLLTPERERGLRYSMLGSAPTTPTTAGPAQHSSSSSSSKSSDMCEACRSFPAGQPGFISNDNDANVMYISSQYPHHPQVFTMVRQACVRSLSCEVCPGREGPIFFGDDHQGHVLSYTFYVQDSQARGFHRWYSIVVVMMDKIYLLNSWPFLVSHIKYTIDNLQSKADVVYQSEQTKCPQRAHRLTMSMNPSNFIQHRGGNKPARSLIELTNYKQVFRLLHQSFTWILKIGGNRLTERLLEGPPTEDSIIDLEKQEETEEGFVKLFSKKVVVGDETGEVEAAEDEEEDLDAPVFRSIRHVLKILGPEKFRELAHHVIIGNQIIVRGKQKPLVRSLIDSLKALLPRGCFRAIYYSNTYEDSWLCNFLGLPLNTALPKHATLYMTVDITEADQPAEEDELLPPSGDELVNYKFEIKTPVQMSEKEPTVLTKMEAALSNDALPDSVVDHWLVCLKEEWMNKVKVLFKFTKAGGNRSDEDTRKLMQVVSAGEQDKAVLKFWMTGLSLQYRNHMLSSAINQTVNTS